MLLSIISSPLQQSWSHSKFRLLFGMHEVSWVTHPFMHQSQLKSFHWLQWCQMKCCEGAEKMISFGLYSVSTGKIPSGFDRSFFKSTDLNSFLETMKLLSYHISFCFIRNVHRPGSLFMLFLVITSYHLKMSRLLFVFSLLIL